jgi:hypothetical protein
MAVWFFNNHVSKSVSSSTEGTLQVRKMGIMYDTYIPVAQYQSYTSSVGRFHPVIGHEGP